LNYSESDIYKLLKNENFPGRCANKREISSAQQVSQVQFCSYFTGLVDILSLREAYKIKWAAITA
jgi:hypothetical protein